jgi:hypothetical protein
LGQELFQPPNVAGWPVDKGWIDNATLMTRLNMPDWILKKKHFDVPTRATFDIQQAQIKNNTDVREDLITYDFTEFEKAFANISDEIRIEKIAEFLLMTNGIGSKKSIINSALINNSPKAVALKVMALPEYQLC